MKKKQKEFWDPSFEDRPDEAMSEEEANALLEGQADDEQSEEQSSEDLESAIEASVEEEQAEEQESAELLTNARLRLEQGRLYEMLLKHDLFDGVDADAKAIHNVQKEVRAFVKERLEILVGLKPDPKLVREVVQVKLPFNELEIDLLKKSLSRLTKGATEALDKDPPAKPAAPRQEGLNRIKVEPKQALKPVSKPSNVRVNPEKPKSKPKAPEVQSNDPPPLTKAPSKMTAAELLARNKATKDRYARPEPAKKLPFPSTDQLIQTYEQRQAEVANGPLGKVLQRLHGNSLTAIETVDEGTVSEGDTRI